MDATWIAGRLREMREAAGLSQKALADKAGLTLAAIAQIESSRRQPGWGTVIALCVALKCTPNDMAKKPADAEKRKPGRPVSEI